MSGAKAPPPADPALGDEEVKRVSGPLGKGVIACPRRSLCTTAASGYPRPAGRRAGLEHAETPMTAARIYRPAKTAMQSGRAKTRSWVLEFEPSARRVNDPLMGWVGSADTRGQVRLRFASRDDAVAYAERHGLDYVVQEPSIRRMRAKNYAEKFRYDLVE